MQKDTLNPLIVKGIDLGTEEYVKSLLGKYKTDKMLQNISPFIGVLRYPSTQFLKPDLSYGKTTQFIGMHYVGYMEMLFPELLSTSGAGNSYTRLSFMLDGVQRQFLSISGASTVSQGVSFKDFILEKYKTANEYIPFNRNALHILSDVEINGGSFAAENDGDYPFIQSDGGFGAFTPDIEFEIAISGYQCSLL